MRGKDGGMERKIKEQEKDRVGKEIDKEEKGREKERGMDPPFSSSLFSVIVFSPCGKSASSPLLGTEQ